MPSVVETSLLWFGVGLTVGMTGWLSGFVWANLKGVMEVISGD